MSFKDRLQSLLDEKNLTASQFGRLAGLKDGTISRWLRGETEPIGENLVKAAGALRVREKWLSKGKGEKKWGPKPLTQDECANESYPIRRVNIHFSDDTGEFSTESKGDYMEPIFLSRKWYEKNNYRPDELIAIQIVGSSMEPTFYDGDWVVINTADTTPKEGATFAIHDNGEAVIRRLFNINKQWLATPDNPDKKVSREKGITEGNFIIGRAVHKQSDHC